MIKSVGIGIIAGLVALVLARSGRLGAAPPGPPRGVFEARLDQSLEASVADILFESAVDQTVTRKLDAQLPRLVFKREPLEAVLARLGREADVDVRVDWDALGSADVSKQHPITMDLTAPRAREAIVTVLSAAHPDHRPLAFAVSRGIVRVSTRDNIATELAVTRVYDVRDLIEENVRARTALMASLPKPPPPDPELGVFGGASVHTPEERADAIEVAAIDEVIGALNVATGHGGGELGMTPARRYFGGRLIVNAPPAEHAQIVDVLRALRATKR